MNFATKQRRTQRTFFFGFVCQCLFILAVMGLSRLCFAQEPPKFPVAVGSKVLGFGPLWVASKQGFFDRQGLDAQLVSVRGAETAVQAVASKSAYIAIPAPDLVMG